MRTPKLAEQDLKASYRLLKDDATAKSSAGSQAEAPVGGTTTSDASMVDHPMMATPVHSQIQTTHLFHELRTRFPEVPEDVVREFMKKHGNNLEQCVIALQPESNYYLYGSGGQTSTSDGIGDAVSSRLQALQMTPNRQRSQSGSVFETRPRSGSTDSRTSVCSAGSGGAGGGGGGSSTQAAVSYSVAAYTTASPLQHSQSVHHYMSTHQQFVTPPKTAPQTAPVVTDFDPFIQNAQPTHANVPQTGCRVYGAPTATVPSGGQPQTGQLTRQGSQPEIHIRFQPVPSQQTPRYEYSGTASDQHHGQHNGPNVASNQTWIQQPPPPSQGLYHPYHSPPAHQPNIATSLHYQPQGWPYTQSSIAGGGIITNNPGPSRPEQFGQGFPQATNGNYSSPGTPSPHHALAPAQATSQSPLQLQLQPYPGMYTPSPTSPQTAAGTNTFSNTQAPYSSSYNLQIRQRSPGLYSPQGPAPRFVQQQSSGSSGCGTPPKSLHGPSFPYTPPPGSQQQQHHVPHQAWPPTAQDIMNRVDPGAGQVQQHPIQPVSLQGVGDNPAGLGVEFHPGVSASMPPMEYGIPGRPTRSGSLNEDQRYTQALLMHQRARMEKLIKDHHENCEVLKSLRQEVVSMEQRSMERTQARSNSFPDSEDVKKMREDNRILQINIQLLAREKDMLDSGDMPLGHLDPKEMQGFYKNIQSGQRGSIHSSTGDSFTLPLQPPPPATTLPPPPTTRRPPRPPPPGPPTQSLPHIGVPTRPPPYDPMHSLAPSHPVTQRSHPSENEEDEEEPGMWSCRACTFRNHPAMDKCEMCEIPRITNTNPAVPR